MAMLREHPDLPESEVIDIENWRNPLEIKFDRLVLVMASMRKCIDLGSKEMREGWWDEKIDKYGNLVRLYHEDTRKSFIEAVKSLMNITVADWDDETKKNVSMLLQSVKERKIKWIKAQSTWWHGLNRQQQERMIKQGKEVIDGVFNTKLDFDNYFNQEELDVYREIFSEIVKLTERNERYQIDMGYEV